MPYPRAFYFMLGVIAVIVIGFWPTYFALGTQVPWQFHAHGMAASLWVLMVTAQSWTAHRKPQLALHRAIGMASLLLFPFLIGGLAAIIDRQAKNYVAGEPLHLLYGPGFMIGTMVAMAAYVTVYYRALKYRRKVWVHAGYMLSTPLILFESPFSRILNAYVGPFIVRGPAEFGRILPSILWSMALELVVIGFIWMKYRAKATPFLVAGGFIVVQMVTMGLLKDSPILKVALTAIGNAPSPAVWITGFVIGSLTSWAGWQAGKRSSRRITIAAQPI